MQSRYLTSASSPRECVHKRIFNDGYGHWLPGYSHGPTNRPHYHSTNFPGRHQPEFCDHGTVANRIFRRGATDQFRSYHTCFPKQRYQQPSKPSRTDQVERVGAFEVVPGALACLIHRCSTRHDLFHNRLPQEPRSGVGQHRE